MTDINEVMDRLEAHLKVTEDWQPYVSIRRHDLKALLSYTKQCREALVPFGEWARLEELHGSTVGHADVPDDAKCTIEFGSLVVLGPTARQFRSARQALSTQPGERE